MPSDASMSSQAGPPVRAPHPAAADYAGATILQGAEAGKNEAAGAPAAPQGGEVPPCISAALNRYSPSNVETDATCMRMRQLANDLAGAKTARGSWSSGVPTRRNA